MRWACTIYVQNVQPNSIRLIFVLVFVSHWIIVVRTLTTLYICTFANANDNGLLTTIYDLPNAGVPIVNSRPILSLLLCIAITIYRYLDWVEQRVTWHQLTWLWDLSRFIHCLWFVDHVHMMLCTVIPVIWLSCRLFGSLALFYNKISESMHIGVAMKWETMHAW